MDPETCLEQMLDAYRRRAPRRADEHRADLLQWMRRGGFAPALLRDPEALQAFHVSCGTLVRYLDGKRIAEQRA